MNTIFKYCNVFMPYGTRSNFSLGRPISYLLAYESTKKHITVLIKGHSLTNKLNTNKS